MANTDPPHEVDDGEAPANRNVDAPDADATIEQVGGGEQQQIHQAEEEGKTPKPAQCDRPPQYNRHDFIGDRLQRMAGREDRCLPRQEPFFYRRGSLVLRNLIHDP